MQTSTVNLLYCFSKQHHSHLKCMMVDFIIIHMHTHTHTHSSFWLLMKCHMNHNVNEIILGGEVDVAFYLEMLHLPARAAALRQPDWWGVWRPHKFYVGVCVKLGCCCGATLQEAAPRRLFKSGIWFAGRLNLALPGLNLGHWVSGTHCDWHTGGTNQMHMLCGNLYLHALTKHCVNACCRPGF